MAEADDKKPLLEANLGPALGIRVFHTWDEIVAFVKTEKTFWEWAANKKRPDLDPIRAAHFSTLNTIEEQAIKNRTPNPDVALRQIKNTFDKHYATGAVFASDDPRAKFLAAFQEEDPAATTYAFLYWTHKLTRQHIQQEDITAVFTGVFRALTFDKLGQYSVAAEKESLDSLRKQWSQFLNDESQASATQKQRQETLESEAEIARKTFESNTALALETANKKLTDLETEHKANLENLVKTFNEKIALRTPVAYWTEKEKEHKDAADLCTRWIFGAAIILILLVLFETWVVGNIDPVFLVHHPYTVWGIFVITVTIGIWMLVILVRNLLSNLHLKADARERRVLVQTYLSLALEGKNYVDLEKDRQLILTSLFRTTPSGLTKEDHAMPPLFELIARAIQKKV